eukprot:s10_g17.t1
MGRIQNKQLDDTVTRVKKLLARKSSHTMAFVLAPLLASAKTLNSSLRGERIEDKMDAKQLASYPVSVRCNPPPSAKKVPMQYPAWCVFCDGSVDENLWSLSDVQESAQMLAGPEFPTKVLQACLQGLQGQSKTVGIVNLTPYDAHLESVCIHWNLQHGLDSPQMTTLSDQNEEVLFSERLLAQQMMKALPRLFLDSSSALPRLFPHSSQTLPRLFLDSSSALPRLFPHSSQTLPRLFLDSSSTLPRLFPDSSLTLPRLFLDSSDSSSALPTGSSYRLFFDSSWAVLRLIFGSSLTLYRLFLGFSLFL